MTNVQIQQAHSHNQGTYIFRTSHTYLKKLSKGYASVMGKTPPLFQLTQGNFGPLQVTLMTDGGDTRDDLTLPKGTDDDEKLSFQLKNDFGESKEIVVTVLKVPYG